MANIYCNLKVFSLRARNESPALLNRIECRYVPQSQNWCMRTERCHRLILFPPRALLIAPDITLHRIAPKIPVPPHIISTAIRRARRSKLNRVVMMPNRLAPCATCLRRVSNMWRENNPPVYSHDCRPTAVWRLQPFDLPRTAGEMA